LAECEGNPVKLQRAINSVDIKPDHEMTVEEKERKLRMHTKKWRECVSKLNLKETDRKKLLAGPFFLAKR